MITKNNLFRILVVIPAFFYITGCSKDNEPEVPIMEAEGYIIGYHPCVTHSTVTTSRGKGKGYLVATTNAKPDTLMVYGVPVNMFDIPDEWFFHSTSYLLPEEGRQRFKIQFSYQLSVEGSIATQYPCNTMSPPPSFKFLKPEYIVVKAKKVE